MKKLVISGFFAAIFLFVFVSFQAVVSAPRFEVMPVSASEAIGQNIEESNTQDLGGEFSLSALSPERHKDAPVESSELPVFVAEEGQATLSAFYGKDTGAPSVGQDAEVSSASDANSNETSTVLSGTLETNVENPQPNSEEENNGGGIWEFVYSLKRDLNYYIQVINKLRDQLSELSATVLHLQLTPGPQGPPGITGAGNIAFIYKDGVGIHALRTDGTVWKWPASGWVAEGTPGIDVPTSTANIVQWQLTIFLDTNGDLWRYDAGSWTNFGHP